MGGWSWAIALSKLLAGSVLHGVFSISNATFLGSNSDLRSGALRAWAGLDFALDLGEYTEPPQTS
jgi:hypothetical protein